MTKIKIENVIGWHDARGKRIDAPDGYNIDYYFDADGRYLGPDIHGIGLTFRRRQESAKKFEKNPESKIKIEKEIVFLGMCKELKVEHMKEKYDLSGAGLFCCAKSKTLFIFIIPTVAAFVTLGAKIETPCANVCKKWADTEVTKVMKLDMPKLSRFAKMGKIKSLVYDSDKWTGKARSYVHKFANAELYYATHAGKLQAFAIARSDGRKIVSYRGIIG